MPTTIEIAETPETWERIENSPEWRGLTPAQKTFVTMFLATGSALDAVHAAYRPTTAHNAQTMSYELSKNRRIVAVLDAASGEVRSERDQLITEVRRHLRAAEPGSVAASRLCAQLGGLLNLGREPEADAADEPTAEPSQKFAVGEVVRQNGTLFKVSAVDADGKILSASEIE